MIKIDDYNQSDQQVCKYKQYPNLQQYINKNN